MDAFEFLKWAEEFPMGTDLFCDGCTAPSEDESLEGPCDTCEVMELINLFEDAVRQEVTELAEKLMHEKYRLIHEA